MPALPRAQPPLAAASAAARPRPRCTPASPQARVRPQDMVPLVGPGFKPTDRDEIGLWKEMERVEEEIAGSNLLIEDPKLTGYLQDIIGTVGGPAAQGFPHLSGADPRLQRDDVPERLCGRLLRACSCACATRRSWPA